MPIKVRFEEGISVEVESLEDAAKLIKLSKNGHLTLPVSNVHEDERAVKLFREINLNARKFFTALLAHVDGITGDKFAEETGFDPEAFGGVLGGASKIAKKYGLSFSDFVVSEMRSDESRRYRFLAPGPLLLKYAERLKKVGVK